MVVYELFWFKEKNEKFGLRNVDQLWSDAILFTVKLESLFEMQNIVQLMHYNICLVHYCNIIRFWVILIIITNYRKIHLIMKQNEAKL